MESVKLLSSIALALLVVGCGGNSEKNQAAEAPPPAQVERVQDVNIIQVDHPDQFPLTTAVEHVGASSLVVTGTVAPDISRTVPAISLASGRVVEIRARLGDTVEKGQLLMRVQSADIAQAYSDYRKAQADSALADTQYERAKDLFQHGAIALNDLQVAEAAAQKSKVDLETAGEHLRVLGSPLDHSGAVVDVRAPISGVITDQQVSNASGVQGLSSANPFTISDLSEIWILCDVYENDLAMVRLGETADIVVGAYPGRTFAGRISNIGAILDPNIRTAKVRIELRNPGLLRPGMFVTATFHGLKTEKFAAVPASAILHLHDRDWVYLPAGAGANNRFRRAEVKAGGMLPNNMQEVLSGLAPGQQVVTNALELQNTAEQ